MEKLYLMPDGTISTILERNEFGKK